MTTALTQTGIAIQKLEQMVSEAPYFQLETGTTAAASALDYIFCPEKRNETEAQQADQSPKAFAVITLPENSAETELVAGGGANWFTLRGTIELHLVRQMDDPTNKRDELTKFLNFSEGVWLYLLEKAAVDDYLAITGAPRQTLIQSDDKSVSGFKVQKPFHKAIYLVSWGPGV